jgi:hypothetical protein
MILKSQQISRNEFETGTGWKIKPEGACKGEICVPLKSAPGDVVDVKKIATDMNLPLVAEEGQGVWALGPDSIGGKTLATATAPNLTLPDLDGKMFELSSLKGKKVLVYAWAPY